MDVRIREHDGGGGGGIAKRPDEGVWGGKAWLLACASMTVEAVVSRDDGPLVWAAFWIATAPLAHYAG